MNAAEKMIKSHFLSHAEAMRAADDLVVSGKATKQVYAKCAADLGWCLFDIL